MSYVLSLGEPAALVDDGTEMAQFRDVVLLNHLDTVSDRVGMQFRSGANGMSFRVTAPPATMAHIAVHILRLAWNSEAPTAHTRAAVLAMLQEEA